MMGIRMSIARCCCSVVQACNILGVPYVSGLQRSSRTNDVLQTRTNWDSNSFLRPPSSLVDNCSVTTNSTGKANSSLSGNYWEVFGQSNGSTGVVSSQCDGVFNVSENAFPNEWDVCANNTAECLYTLACQANPSSIPQGAGFPTTGTSGWTVTLRQGDLPSYPVAQVTYSITLDIPSGTYSSELTVTQTPYIAAQGTTSGVTTTTNYPLTSTANSGSGSVKLRVTPLPSTFTNITHNYGPVDKWKLEYDVTVGGQTVTIPDMEFDAVVEDALGNNVGFQPFQLTQGDRLDSLLGPNFKTRYSDVSSVISNT